MNLVTENVSTLRDSIQRNNFQDTSVLDIFTAFYVILTKPTNSNISDDKNFGFLLGAVSNVQTGIDRNYWFDNMFRIYEKLSKVATDDPGWLLLQANLIYLQPKYC